MAVPIFILKGSERKPMMKQLIVVSMVLAFSAIDMLWAQSRPPLDSVNSYVISEMARQKIPGLSVAILRGDQVVLARGYGWANVELRAPASDSTIYQSGSLGKQFTAAAVVRLSEQGRLRLDDVITKWLPEGRGVWDSVTVRHLLTHTSGVAEYTDSTFDLRKDYTEEQLVRFASSRPLDFRPGERWSYSNTGYLLLGAIIRRVTGHFYGDVLHDILFAPLGMRTTRIISEADIIPNRAAGYQLINKELKNQEWVSPSLNTTADGALYFSVNDLTKWAAALNHRRFPSASGLALAWTPVRLNDGGSYPYGFGWDLTDQRGHPRIGHTGAWQGFETAIYRYPEFDLTVIALANLAQSTPGAIAQGIAGILEPAILPAHLLPAALSGAPPPVPIPELLQQIASARDSGSTTPGLQHFLSAATRREAAETLQQVKSWTPLGCDRVAERSISRLGAKIDCICYLRGTGDRGGSIVSAYYTGEGRAAYLDIGGY
jgi:CubicO group peptidase (beta-lactamase class C family)